MYTKQHFNYLRTILFNEYWEEYLDNLTPSESAALDESLNLEGEHPFLDWLEENAVEVERYILATPKQRARKKAWQKQRYLFAYARWRILCKGLVIYEWLQKFDPQHLEKTEETLMRLVDESNRVHLVQSTFPKRPLKPDFQNTYPFWDSRET